MEEISKLKRKTCLAPLCEELPTTNTENIPFLIYCKYHRQVHAKCWVKECLKHPSYGLIGDKLRFCKIHSPSNISVPKKHNKYCEYENEKGTRCNMKKFYDVNTPFRYEKFCSRHRGKILSYNYLSRVATYEWDKQKLLSKTFNLQEPKSPMEIFNHIVKIPEVSNPAVKIPSPGKSFNPSIKISESKENDLPLKKRKHTEIKETEESEATKEDKKDENDLLIDKLLKKLESKEFVDLFISELNKNNIKYKL